MRERKHSATAATGASRRAGWTRLNGDDFSGTGLYFPALEDPTKYADCHAYASDRYGVEPELEPVLTNFEGVGEFFIDGGNYSRFKTLGISAIGFLGTVRFTMVAPNLEQFGDFWKFKPVNPSELPDDGSIPKAYYPGNQYPNAYLNPFERYRLNKENE